MNEGENLNLSDTYNNKKQIELLHKVVADNKSLSNEIRSQLDVIEALEDGKTRLAQKLDHLRKEAEFFKQRDTLNLKRNAALSRKNRILHEKLNEMATQMMIMKKSFDKHIVTVESSFEGKLDDAEKINDRLQVEGVVREAKLKKMRKDCQHLVDTNKRMRKILGSRSRSKKDSSDY